jgi:Uncharacterized protein conserved in bacteria (DUF2188)
VTDSKFSVSRPAQRAYKVLGGARPSGARAAARAALSKAQSSRKVEAVHITHRKDGWAVKSEGRERAASVEPTKAKAIESGRKAAAGRGARLIEHRTDGQIIKNTKPSAGSKPPKGKPKRT